VFYVLAFGPPARTIEALWKTDGTSAGTAQLSLVNVPRGSEPGRWGASGGVFYFRSSTGGGGDELWRSDGTSTGTRRVADIVPGPQGSDPSFITAAPRPDAPNGIYFMAKDEADGTELWYSDGTEAGTRRVAPLLAGQRIAPDVGLQVANDRVYFIVGYTGVGNRGRLWMSDGTEAGTGELGFLQPAWFEAWGLATCRGRAYFSFQDLRSGRELWTTDGTAGGTQLVYDLQSTGPGGLAGGLSAVVVNSRLYFGGDDGQTGPQRWVLDTCPADFDNDGRVLVQDVFAYLVAYFDGVDRADFNRTDGVSIQDLFDWLSEFFAG
jgi:ELWxxDGT repeat protein